MSLTEMKADIGAYAGHIPADTLDLLCKYLVIAGVGRDGISALKGLSYFHAPASAGHHGARIGCLAQHSVNVTRWLLRIGDTLGVEWTNRRTPYVIGLLHDLCKCDDYTWTEDGKIAKVATFIPGHGVHSAILAPLVVGPLSAQEVAGIVHHMGAWTTDRDTPIANLDAAIKKFPRTVIAVHAADMMASQVDENEVFVGRSTGL